MAVLSMAELIREIIDQADWQLNGYSLLKLRLDRVELGQQNDGLTYLASFRIKAVVMSGVDYGSK